MKGCQGIHPLRLTADYMRKMKRNEESLLLYGIQLFLVDSPDARANHLYHFSQTEKKRDDMLDYAMKNFAFSLSLLINPRRNPFVETV